MHTLSAQVSKSMHPAAEMCTKGAGCSLNFEHCLLLLILLSILIVFFLRLKNNLFGLKKSCGQARFAYTK